MTEDRLCVMQ